MGGACVVATTDDDVDGGTGGPPLAAFLALSFSTFLTAVLLASRWSTVSLPNSNNCRNSHSGSYSGNKSICYDTRWLIITIRIKVYIIIKYVRQLPGLQQHAVNIVPSAMHPQGIKKHTRWVICRGNQQGSNCHSQHTMPQVIPLLSICYHDWNITYLLKFNLTY